MRTGLGTKFRYFRLAVGVYLAIITLGLGLMLYAQSNYQKQVNERFRLKNYSECVARRNSSTWVLYALGTLRDAEQRNPAADPITKRKRIEAYDKLLNSPVPPVDCEKLYGPAPKE